MISTRAFRTARGTLAAALLASSCLTTAGGDGGHGLVRLEDPQVPSPTALGVVRGPTMVDSFPNVPGQPLGFYVQGGCLDPVSGEVQVAGPLLQTMAELDSDAATQIPLPATSSWTVPLVLPDLPQLRGLRIASQTADGPTNGRLGFDGSNAMLWFLEG